MDTPHRRLFRKRFVVFWLGDAVAIRAVPLNLKRGETFWNYQGNQRLAKVLVPALIDENRTDGVFILAVTR
jgi:hypothetical protein